MHTGWMILYRAKGTDFTLIGRWVISAFSVRPVRKEV